MVEPKSGGYIQTYKGVLFYPLNPKPEDILIEDIAHALSLQCRYSGHVTRHYSVAEHSLAVMQMCFGRHDGTPKWGLLHDASEAYLVDLPWPIKEASEMGSHYKDIEQRLMKCICERFGLPLEMPEVVAKADKAMLYYEAKALMPKNECWEIWRSYPDGLPKPAPIDSMPDDPSEIEHRFLGWSKILGLN